jgi:hypothetical protein
MSLLGVPTGRDDEAIPKECCKKLTFRINAGYVQFGSCFSLIAKYKGCDIAKSTSGFRAICEMLVFTASAAIEWPIVFSLSQPKLARLLLYNYRMAFLP